MSKLFNIVKKARTKTSAFDMSHEKKFSCKMGSLVPIMVDEIVPGDKWKVKSEVLVRLAPMIAPVMHRTNVSIHYFFVPNRIIWDNWEDFITGKQELLAPISASTTPVIKGGIWDFLGIPPGTNLAAQQVSMLPAWAYTKIYNEYYRDQNQQTEVDPTGMGGGFNLLNRAWEKDYFTSALPSTQQGAPIEMPVSNNITYKPGVTKDINGVFSDGNFQAGATAGQLATSATDYPENEKLLLENIEKIEGIVDINDFRIANRLQQWAERQIRSGNRYVETLISHFGVSNNDLRMMRPQYLGGGKMPVTISEVLNTNGNTLKDENIGSSLPLGEMAGHGIGVGSTPKTTARFTEHGWMFGIMSVLPRTAYQNGIHRSFLRKDKFQFFWPEFANIGEHAVLNKEIFVSTDQEYNDGTFGYQSQYSDLKYKGSSVHGDFRDNLSFYHMGRIFEETPDTTLPTSKAAPSLNAEFIECKPTEINNRVFQVADGTDQLWVQVYNNVTAIRPMPYYGTPHL